MGGREQPVRVFIGSAPARVVEETVIVHSLLAHASRPVDIRIIDCVNHCLRTVGTSEVEPLPEAWRGRLAGGNAFSFARFAPPELCGFAGRAIYCEPDQLVLGDIAELWDLPLDAAHVAAVPFAALSGDPPPYQSEGYLSSVLLFDAAACRSVTVPTITDAVRDGAITYSDAISMTDPLQRLLGLRLVAMPARWNALEHPGDDVGLIHFTDKSRRPWTHPGHPANGMWRNAYLATVDAGLLDAPTLDRARSHGWISRRARALPVVPRGIVGPVDALLQAGERIRRSIRRLRPVLRRGSPQR